MEAGISAPAGLYIHVPFCTSVCPYCDFAVTIAGQERRGAWVDGVLREAVLYADHGFDFDTIYLGGGTPSSLDCGSLARVLEGLREVLGIDDGARVHLEVNPEDVTGDNLRVWEDLGVAFVSVGVQSLDDDELRFLGRRHTARRAEDAVRALVEAGFHTVSLDLIYGLAGQTAASWRGRLRRAAELGVHHLSCYQLTVHGGTVFGRRAERGERLLPPDEAQAELFIATHETAAELGLPAYEVSNFARGAEHRSRHNQKYWNLSPYLGLGPSAHSFAGGRRWWNHRKLRLWQRNVDRGVPPVESSEAPTPEQSLLELVMLRLRTVDGIDLAEVTRRFGVDLVGRNERVVREFVASGHLVLTAARLRPTPGGLAVADTLALAFDLSGAQTPERDPT